MRFWAPIAALSSLIVVVACTSDPKDHPCVDASLECRPSYDPPTFDSIYTGILQPNCASVPGTCHTSSKVSGGIDMGTEDSAFSALKQRVQTNNVGCSVLIRRVESDDPEWRMPLGNDPLSEPDRCTIRKWVAGGAQK